MVLFFTFFESDSLHIIMESLVDAIILRAIYNGMRSHTGSIMMTVMMTLGKWVVYGNQKIISMNTKSSAVKQTADSKQYSYENYSNYSVMDKILPGGTGKMAEIRIQCTPLNNRMGRNASESAVRHTYMYLTMVNTY